MAGVAAAGAGEETAGDAWTAGVACARVADAVTLLAAAPGVAIFVERVEPPPHAARISASARNGVPSQGLHDIV